jgi:hypothetical protein
MAVTATQLKSYFEHGDVPSESQFKELIDYITELFNNAQTTANNAAAAAAAAQAAAPKALLKGVISPASITAHTNVASFALQSSTATSRTMRLTFTAPLANANYIVAVSGPPIESGGVVVDVTRVVAQTTTTLDVLTGLTGTLFVVCI